MENQWLSFVKKLHSISETGLTYAKDPFDRERYVEISRISSEMLAMIGCVPIERIKDLVSAHTTGYATPMVDVRGAVFKENKILLVQEKSDQRWTLPGGFADVGFSASENTEKEIMEEAGIPVKARQLYAIRHKAKAGFHQDARDFYKLYFICEAMDQTQLCAGTETMDARYFGQDDVPTLSKGRVILEDLHRAWCFHQDSNRPTFFD